MTNVRSRVVFGVLLTILGAATFLVVAAFALDHVSSTIFAAIVGGLAFPVLPVVWHIVGERRRTQRRAVMKAPPKTSLTGGDRFWMRFAAVVLVVIGPMVAIGRGGVVRAVWRHGLWFIPAAEPGPRDTSALLRHVPGDAELVVIVHERDDKHDGDGVLAWGNGQVMAAADGKLTEAPTPQGIADLNTELKNQHWLASETVQLVSTSDTSIVASSPGWRGKVESLSGGLSPELDREVARAPHGTVFVAAFVPKTTRDALSIRTGVVWATRENENLVVEARVEATDDAAAAKLVIEGKAALHLDTKAIPERCVDPVGKIADQIHFTQAGPVVTLRAIVPSTTMFGLLMCLVVRTSGGLIRFRRL